jgi:hypothetical protein
VLVTTQIQKEHIEVGCSYIGRGRNGNIGLWNGSDFQVIGEEGIHTGLSGKDKWRKEFFVKEL